MNPFHEPGKGGFHSVPDFTQQSEEQYQGRSGTRPYQFGVRSGNTIWEAAVSVILMVLFQCGCDRQPTRPADNVDKASFPPKTELVPLTTMVPIKPGTFIRGKYPVSITRGFWLGKYEVTQAEFEAVMGRNPSHFKDDPLRPVEKVSYVDAVAYCSALTRREREAKRLPDGYEYRLPSEAEWEYACRAGTTNFFSFGDAATEADPYAWTSENSDSTTHPVGQKRPNPWGLHDVHGNVWEWCLDWFGDYPTNGMTNPLGPAQGKFKVFRGGSWYHDADFARSANRFMMAPSNGIYFVGFRVALGSPPIDMAKIRRKSSTTGEEPGNTILGAP
ncbi:MAG: formylglycine-generating enzyme family protein [Verrucomicrobia bacterium]|nr:formylglycine-generating enzyme family protein [Verrucomicrobiota bacterium]